MKEITAAAKIAHETLQQVSVAAADCDKVKEVFQCLELIFKLSNDTVKEEVTDVDVTV